MLYELCLELNNFFEYAKFIGDITISDGNVQTDLLEDGQYFRIVGSKFNDGVYQYPTRALKDETYRGGLWAMAVPPAVIALSEEVNDWQRLYSTADKMSPYQSESFGGYSYTKATGSSSGSATASWQDVYKGKLDNWRKLK